VIFGKRVRDCVGWGIGESKANDVVQGLAQNVAGGRLVTSLAERRGVEGGFVVGISFWSSSRSTMRSV